MRGENAEASPKEQITKVMNLSGKKTRTGRISGECCIAATNEESHYGKLSGSRTEISLFREISVLFSCLHTFLSRYEMKLKNEEEFYWHS